MSQPNDIAEIPPAGKNDIQIVDDGPVYQMTFNGGDQQLITNYVYPTNYIRTTKYTAISFLPVNLFNQFRRFSNIYFLIAAIFAFFRNASAISPVTQVSPLIFVLLATAIKDGLEDYNRYKSDKQANSAPFEVIRNSQLMKVVSKDIQVGDIVWVRKGEVFPADLILLSSSFTDGTCFVETSQLDGETNLKRKMALASTASKNTIETISQLSGRVECEMPNIRMNQFEGRIVLQGQSVQPLTTQQILLRGSQLRNCDFVFGACVYAGIDTKIIRNLNNSGLKFSTMEWKLNRLLMLMFCYNAVIFTVSVVFGTRWIYTNLPDKANYISGEEDLSTLSFLQGMTYYILYTYTIPISLFISLEIVRIIQSLLISHDQNLKFTIPTGEEVSAKARNSNLNEDLGKIQHIFSDKTGTLTQNMMQLSYWYVSGTIFDEMANPGALGGAIKVFVVSVLVFIAIVVKYSQSSETPPEKREQLKQFARHVAVCHTTLTTRSDKTNEIVYEAESPDESALLNALRPSGLLLASRSKTEIILDNDGQSESFEVLELIEFNSDRKRMTVIVRVGKEIHLYCKGADSIIMKRLKKDHDRTVIEDFDRQLVEFSNRGLRTLLFAWRVISEEEYLIFRQRFDEASSALQSREQKMSDAASEIEQNMSLIGCSAIEDKLQDQVPETIDYLLNCGIKVWVLTGDKRETAINIAKSCKLFSSNTVLLSGDFDDDQACQVAFNQYQNMLDRLMVGQRAALVITGDSLRVALESRAEQFLQLANRCHSVLCCRVTPLQKAAVVSLVRQTSKKVVLSVGDGANDVPMIQAANVGVGIVGMEGAQAVRASDYSIGQFRGLRRLIAVHGRYFKLGITEMIYFSLYKNIAQITVCFWFGLHSAWSGLQIYQENFLAYFNVFFMSLPPLAMGAFERDIDEDVIEQIPKTYQSSLDDKFFSKAKTVKYLLIGIWHSAVIYLSLYMLMYGQSFSDHKSVSYWLQSWFASSILMFILSGKYMLIVKNWMWIIQLSVGLSIAIYMVFFGVSDKIGLTTEGNSASNLHQFAEYYLFVLVTFFIALLPDILWRYAQLQWMPSDADILAECKRVSNDNTSGIFRRKLSKRNTRSVRVQRSADTKTQSVVTTQQINFLYDPANDKAAKSNGEDQIPTIEI